MRATFAGSAGSRRISWIRGLPLGTEQKPHPRVHRFPRIMNVAAPRWKHSWIFGHRADSHTVWRFNARSSDWSLFNDSKCVALFRAHPGRRGRAEAAGDETICTRESLKL